MIVDPLGHWCLDNGRNDLELAAAVRAVLEADFKDVKTQPAPEAPRLAAIDPAKGDHPSNTPTSKSREIPTNPKTDMKA